MNNSFILAVYQRMKCYFSSMKTTATLLGPSLLSALVVASVFLSHPTARADEAAERILAGVRHGATLQHGKLDGYLRKNGKRTPLNLAMKGKDISFQYYTNKRWSGFHMQLHQGRAKLFETIDGRATPFPPAKIGQSILKSDVTYEDLSLRFLYWKNATIVGEATVKGQKCHKLRLVNPGKHGRYSIVYIFVHKKYGALMQVAGYNKQGKILKRFHVTDIMTVGKITMLQKMNVETYNPTSGRVTGISYLEFKKPKKRRRGL